MTAVVFDLFHTLVDPEDFRPKGFFRGVVAAQICGFQEQSFLRYWEQTSAERNTTPLPTEGWLQRYAEQVGADVPPAAVAGAAEVLSRYQTRAILQPRRQVTIAIGALREKGVRLGLLSNAHTGEAAAWASSPLAPLFDVACFSCCIGAAKPDAAAYGAVLARLGVRAEEAVFVGDGLNDELVGAKDAGFRRVIAATWFISRNGLRSPAEVERLKSQADAWIDDMDELAASSWLPVSTPTA